MTRLKITVHRTEQYEVETDDFRGGNVISAAFDGPLVNPFLTMTRIEGTHRVVEEGFSVRRLEDKS